MQLTLHSEYALRVLLYLGCHPGEVLSTKEISRAFTISRHHLVRVMQTLSDQGYVQLIPGRSGGVSLAIEPRLIRIGDVVRKTEAAFRIAECFDKTRNTCCIVTVCSLKPALEEALRAFLGTLNTYTLDDLMGHGTQRRLVTIFESQRPAARNRHRESR